MGRCPEMREAGEHLKSIDALDWGLGMPHPPVVDCMMPHKRHKGYGGKARRVICCANELKGNEDRTFALWGQSPNLGVPPAVGRVMTAMRLGGERVPWFPSPLVVVHRSSAVSS